MNVLSVGPPPAAGVSKNNVIPSLFINKDGRTVFRDAYKSFDRMWRLLTLPLAYEYKGIFDMLVLMGKQHHLALQPNECHRAFQTQSYAELLCTVSNLLERSPPPEVILTVISTLFAYERLGSATTATDPPDRFTVHSNALKSIMAQSTADKNVETYFKAPSMFHAAIEKFFFDRSQSNNIDTGTVFIPDHFADFYEGRDCFFEILKTHSDNNTTRKRMTLWGMTMRKMFDNCRAEDWNDGRRALTLLTEFELIRTIFESTTRSIASGRVETMSPWENDES